MKLKENVQGSIATELTPSDNRDSKRQCSRSKSCKGTTQNNFGAHRYKTDRKHPGNTEKAKRGDGMQRTEADSLYAASFSPAASMEIRERIVKRCVVPLLLCTGRDLMGP